MSGHTIVCGMGHIGYRVVRLLRRMGETVTVVTQDSRQEWIENAEALGVRVCVGDVRNERLLREAGLNTATSVIAATDDDLANIEVLLDVAQIRPDVPVVVRIFDQALAHQIEESFQIRRALGRSYLAAPIFAAAALAEHVIGSFHVDNTAYVIGQLTVEPDSALCGATLSEGQCRTGLTVLDLDRQDHEQEGALNDRQVLRAGDRVTVVARTDAWEAQVREQARRAGALEAVRTLAVRVMRSLRPRVGFQLVRDVWRNVSLPLRTITGVLMLLILFSILVFRFGLGLTLVDAFYYAVTTVTTTGFGDVPLDRVPPALKIYGSVVMILGSAAIGVLYALITDFVVTARFRQMFGRQRIPSEGHIIVAGLGNVGYRVVEELHEAGFPVAAIDSDPNGPFLETVRLHAPVLIGDARLPHTLAKAGVAKARAVVAATDDDIANLSIALTAREARPEINTVVRLYDASFAAKVQAVAGTGRALSASMVAAPTFAAAALYPGVHYAFVLGSRMFIVQGREAGDAWHGQTAAGLHAAGTVVLAHRARSASAMETVEPGDVLRRDDHILVVESKVLSEETGPAMAADGPMGR